MTDAYAILGLPRRFDLDPGEIERAYLERAAAHHPDVAPDDEDGGDRLAALNEARAVLADPERRADRLLALLGGPGKSDSRALPGGFLMDILETRERVEADRGDPARLAHWQSWADERRAEYIGVVAGLFASLGEPPEPDGLGAIREQLNAWRYIERLIEQLDPDYDPGISDFD